MTIQIPDVIYLSRRKLLASLSKLDRGQAGESTSGSIIKYQMPMLAYQQTSKSVLVVAVDDEEYYGAQQRGAGAMIKVDETRLPKPLAGVFPRAD